MISLLTIGDELDLFPYCAAWRSEGGAKTSHSNLVVVSLATNFLPEAQLGAHPELPHQNKRCSYCQGDSREFRSSVSGAGGRHQLYIFLMILQCHNLLIITGDVFAFQLSIGFYSQIFCHQLCLTSVCVRPCDSSKYCSPGTLGTVLKESEKVQRWFSM